MLQIFESVAVWRKHWASAMEAIKAAAGSDEKQAKKKQKVEKTMAELEEKTAVRCPFPLSAHCLLLSPPSVRSCADVHEHARRRAAPFGARRQGGRGAEHVRASVWLLAAACV